MKDILPMLLYILFINLNTQRSYNQWLSLHIILHITTIIELKHPLQMIITSWFQLTIISYNHNSIIWTFMCIMSKLLTSKTPNLLLMLRLSNIFFFLLQSNNLLPNKGRFSAILGAIIGFIYVLLSSKIRLPTRRVTLLHYPFFSIVFQLS